MILNTEFPVNIIWKKKLLELQAKLAFEGEALERWELHLGDKLFYFENNRPELARNCSHKRVQWKITKGLENIKRKTHVPDVVLMFPDLWAAIEQISYSC